MNRDTIQGKAEQLKAKIKETWGRLTDDDVALYEAKRDQFFGKLQEKYGLMKDEAEEQVRELEEQSRRAA
ncbi:MAG: CsbD family protein [Alphaproteobacteria bacterium]|nr:CsbD family protein [Alphaproteobacteria bacterium]